MEDRGLTHEEARRRLDEHGPNELPAAEGESALRRTLRQLRSPLNYVLLFALGLELVLWRTRGEAPWGALVIALTLLVNLVVGLLQERRSQAALERLRELAAPRSWVVRAGQLVHVPSRELVPGDVVRLDGGDRVPADGTLLTLGALPFDESLLTGESFPVDHGDGAPVHAGTLLLRGQAHIIVTATGHRSALGRIATLLSAIELGQTPLERRLDRLGNQLAIGVLALALLVSLLGLAAEGLEHLPEVLLFAGALAVAAVPEELPAAFAFTLALGVERMAERNALLRRLPSVETLGSVTTICTDKTGTLTMNRLRVRGLHARDEQAALRAMALANDARGDQGDSVDVALLEHARSEGVGEEVRLAAPRVSERPFDSQWKFQRVSVQEPGGVVSYLKGAPEVLLARARLPPGEAEALASRVADVGRAGRRVLALARAPGEAEDGLEVLGLVELEDPLRPEAAESVRLAEKAGIRVVLVTGDHPATASTLAREAGLQVEGVVTGDDVERASDDELVQLASRATVFARVLPHHKLRLVEALQRRGEVVAMIGDGVNDAPALRRADIGVAMGQRGSDVAREAAALVLLDDNFATVVDAIHEGRAMQRKLQTTLRFMLSTSIGFILLVLLGSIGAYVLGLRAADGRLLVPLTAIQILWINLLADGPASFALALDRYGAPETSRPPAREDALLDRESVRFIAAGALVKVGIAALLLLALPWLGYGVVAIQTAVFTFEYLAQLAFAAPSRPRDVQAAPNRALGVTLVACVLAQLAVVATPAGRAFLGLDALSMPLLAALFTLAAGTGVAAHALRAGGKLRWTPAVSWSRRPSGPRG